MPLGTGAIMALTSLHMLVQQYLDYVEKVERLSRSSVLNRKYILGPFARDLDIADVRDITPFDIDGYLMTHCAKDKPSSLMTRRRIIRLFFQYCQEYREIKLRFDYAAIRLRKVQSARVKPLSHDLVSLVISDCKEEQDALIIALMFETGMRIGEIIRLQVEDMAGPQISIRGKGEKDRIVCMTAYLARSLRNYLSDKGRFSGHVFRPLQKQVNHPDAHYVSAYAVRDRIEREFMNHGISMHPHQLRHSFAVYFIHNGGDIRTLQLLLGHENLETTERYLNFSNPQITDTYSRVVTKSVLA